MTAETPADLVTVLKAASNFALCARDDVKTELKISGSAEDSWIDRAIAAQSKIIANYCNRQLATQVYGEQIFRPRRRGWRGGDGPARGPLSLRAWPIVSTPSPALTAPPTAPILGSTPGGALAQRLYYVKASYVTANGETAASLEASIAVGANKLLTVAAPGPDTQGIATGWRVYVGLSSWGETMQAELALNAGFVEPTSGYSAGSPLPNYLLVVENCPAAAGRSPFSPSPLAEGLDFVADADAGMLERLSFSGQVCAWSRFPLTVQYSAGYATTPDDVKDAAIRLVAGRYAARGRDPNLKSEGVTGMMQQSYVAGDARKAIPDEIAFILDEYCAPQVG